ncbi:MAG: ComEA family DNA-binding protein [Culicoidibacterales bacterium]
MKQLKQYGMLLLKNEGVKLGLCVANFSVLLAVVLSIGYLSFQLNTLMSATSNPTPDSTVVVAPIQPSSTPELVEPSTVEPTTQLPPADSAPPTTTTPVPQAEPSANPVVDGKININSAPANLLEELPGIGPQKAQAIIEFRQQTPFQQPSDVMNVTGIGEKTYEKLKDLIFVQ